jgi:plastocyanin
MKATRQLIAAAATVLVLGACSSDKAATPATTASAVPTTPATTSAAPATTAAVATTAATTAPAAAGTATTATTALAAGTATTAGGASATSGAPAVSIGDFMFQPDAIKVPVGGTVTWTNNHTQPHTATSAGNFDTGSIAPGSSKTITFPTAGTYSYICSFHPFMTGTVVVA